MKNSLPFVVRFVPFYLLATLVSVSLLATGCGDEDETNPLPDTEDTGRVIAVAGDFQASGTLATIGIPSLTVVKNAVDGAVGNDPVLRILDDKIYVINRSSDSNITILQQEDLALVAQFSTGEGFNPQDLAVVGNNLYVVGLGAAEIRVFDVETINEPFPPAVLIDLSAVDPTDNNPDCGSIYAVGNSVFVVCGIFDEDFQTQGAGRVVTIDATSNSVISDNALTHANPFGQLQQSIGMNGLGDGLLVSTVPNFSDLTEGCLEKIGLDGASQGCLVENTTLGGFASAYQPNNGEIFLLSVTTGYGDGGRPDAFIASYSEADGVSPTITGGSSFDVVQCPGGEQVIAEAGKGLRVFGKNGAELTTAPLGIGIAPVQSGIGCLAK